MQPPGDRLFWTLLATCAAAAVWSFAGAGDKATWAFEVLPLTAVMAVFAVRRRRFRFSDLAYVLLTWFYLIQCLGGRYTFAATTWQEAPYISPGSSMSVLRSIQRCLANPPPNVRW